jgi:hypothetical protein
MCILLFVYNSFNPAQVSLFYVITIGILLNWSTGWGRVGLICVLGLTFIEVFHGPINKTGSFGPTSTICIPTSKDCL